MAHVAHQCICMQYLLELAKQLETDPRACISSFFTKIQVPENIFKLVGVLSDGNCRHGSRHQEYRLNC